MLEIIVPAGEIYDESKEEFITMDKPQVLQLEHSLISISKWEEKWCVPYFSDKEVKTTEQVLDYLKCMTINKNVNPDAYSHLSSSNIEAINRYIESKHTATWFSSDEKKQFINRGGRRQEVITSEIFYYWMIALQIPFECEKWHINRLITLIRVCQEKNEPAKKMSKAEILKRNRSLNAARRAALHTKG